MDMTLTTRILTLVVCLSGVLQVSGEYQRYCYLESVARLREGAGQFTVNDLHDVTLCTHLVFVNAMVDPVIPDLVPALNDDIGYYQSVTDLKQSYPDLKVLLLVGGPDTSNSQLFSDAVNSTESMDKLVPNVLSYLTYYRFDGVELDWRYPGRYGSIDDDTYRYTAFIRKLSDAFYREASETGSARLMLNVRVTGDKDLLKTSVQVEEVARFADFVVVTAYDFYLAESVIGHNSGLYGRSSDPNAFAILNADYIVQFLSQYSGVSAQQLIMGIPAYGRTSVFVNETMQAFGVHHDGPGSPGPYTKEPGLLAYYEICSRLRNGWSEIMDSDQQTPFAFNDEEIVTYDNVDSIIAKANYVKIKGLAGVALWDLSYDDFSGVFCDQGRFPLATALRNTLNSPISHCPAGQHGELDIRGCVACPVGTFQPSSGTMACIFCPQGLTTLTANATHEYKCILPCPSGSEYNYVTSSCDPCPLGYYRKEGHDPACLKCAPGYTTVATSSEDCVRRPAGVPEISPRQINVKATVTFATMSCENKPVIVGAVRMLVASYFTRLAQIWFGLCDEATCENVASDVTRGCEGGYSRRKRQAEELLVVTILVANVSEEVNSTTGTRQTQSVIAEALSERVEFQPLTTYGIRFAKLESLQTELVCDIGSAEFNGRCEPCPAGSHHNTTLGTCSPCPLGHYQHLEGQAACWPCQGVLSTRSTGAESSDLCVSPCEARPNYCYNEGVCHWTEAGQGSVYCECRNHYQGERCATPSGVASARTGTVVGAVVGGVLAFLIVVLIIVACCVCYRVRRAVKLKHVNERQNSVQSNNHYMTWGTFSKGNSARGVKFVDYIDYYMWLSNVPEQQQMTQQPSYRSKPRRTSHLSSTRSKATTTTTTEMQPHVNGDHDHTSTNGGPTTMSGIAETNVDAADKSDHDENVY